MKRFTWFTFLYLALGVCLTAIALGYPNLPSSLQTSLFVSAGASYVVCILSTEVGVAVLALPAMRIEIRVTAITS
jgi:hypothetical protein